VSSRALARRLGSVRRAGPPYERDVVEGRVVRADVDGELLRRASVLGVQAQDVASGRQLLLQRRPAELMLAFEDGRHARARAQIEDAGRTTRGWGRVGGALFGGGPPEG